MARSRKESVRAWCRGTRYAQLLGSAVRTQVIAIVVSGGIVVSRCATNSSSGGRDAVAILRQNDNAATLFGVWRQLLGGV